MKLTKRRIVWGLILLALAALLTAAFWPKPVSIETGVVTRGPLRVLLEADGITRIHDRYVVSAPVSGRLMRVDLRDGDPVSPGMSVATLLPPPIDPLQQQEIEARIAAARAALDGVRAAEGRSELALSDAERERKRLGELLAAGAVPRQQSENAESAVRAATRDLETARSRTRGAESDLAQVMAARGAYQGSGTRSITLRSPVRGRVLRLLETSERVLPAGTPIMQVGDPLGVEVVIDLLSSDAVPVRAGAPIVIDGWGGEQTLRARVGYVEPAAFTKISALGIEEQRVNVIATLIDHPAELGDGFRVRAGIILWESPSVVKVPSSALFRSGGGWSTFVVKQGKAVRVPVAVGHRSALEAEVLSGLREGDRVIVHPSDQVTNGVAVERAEEPEREP